jgi:hypothetical protein
VGQKCAPLVVAEQLQHVGVGDVVVALMDDALMSGDSTFD